MRRSVEQLAAALERGLAPVYLITGDEPLQRLESTDAVRRAARTQGYDERVVLHSDTGIDWSALRFQADSLSLFASRRLIEMRLHEPKVGSDGSEALRDYCAAPAPDVVVLIAAPKFDSRSQSAEWYKAIDRAGEIVQVWPLKTAEMPRWIAKRLAARGLKATPEAVRLLADRVEGNLLAARQDIDKLALLTRGEVTVETVMAAVGDSARFELFAYSDTALAGDGARAVRMLRGLKDEGVEPVLICWALIRELRAASLLSAGTRPETAIPGYRLFPARETLLKSIARRLSGNRLRNALRHATHIDRMVKGAAPGDAWGELTVLTLHLAGREFGSAPWIH